MIARIRKTLPLRLQMQRGFSLLEIMIAVLVLAIGLLGLSALQANGLRANGSAQQRSQAVALANDMMERLRADFRNAIAGAYDRDIGDELPGAGSIPGEELINWVTTLQMLLPAADGAVICDGIGNCTVTVQWDDSRAGGSNAESFSFSSQI